MRHLLVGPISQILTVFAWVIGGTLAYYLALWFADLPMLQRAIMIVIAVVVYQGAAAKLQRERHHQETLKALERARP